MKNNEFSGFVQIADAKNQKVKLFDHISKSEQQCLIACFSPKVKSYRAGENIIDYQSAPERIGVILSGKAQVAALDVDGNAFIIEELSDDAVFGELFLLPLADRGYAVEALTDCQVMFIRYSDIIKRCEHACAYHSQLVDNLFQMTAVKARYLGAHLQILSQRSTRDKLLCYFSFVSRELGKTFELPMTWSRLADYLCVNRSALMREIKKMNEQKVLFSDGKTIRML